LDGLPAGTALIRQRTKETPVPNCTATWDLANNSAARTRTAQRSVRTVAAGQCAVRTGPHREAVPVHIGPLASPVKYRVSDTAMAGMRMAPKPQQEDT